MVFHKRNLKLCIIPVAVLFIAFLFGYAYLFAVIPGQDPDGKFTRENILRNLSGESRVFYRDGNTVIGSFFDTNHRLYAPYDSIPQNLVDAIVSAEDANFWEHGGFDIWGFSRAMFNNIKSFSFRQGGSTLSQQTAKNIFGREEKSFKAKWIELKDALRLEGHFSKHDILEFYLNQFQVYGSGRGAAIAALYFFNKNLSELSLAECAFIAGTVKGPYNYDPRVQKTPEKAARAEEKGINRTKYVLRRMFENGYISQEVFDSTAAAVSNGGLQLNYGEFRFKSSSLLEKVERELNSDFYARIFDSLGVEDWRKSQIGIVTTLDSGLQRDAENSVRENLISLGEKIGIDTATTNCLSANPASENSCGENKGALQGALAALRSGEVLAAQSGYNNIGYDRVFTAQRQFGSSWKPLLYALALKLGWHSLSDLENEYNLFNIGGLYYFPRPDHIERAARVSIAWTAVRSENIASIWLLEHLLDKLSSEDIKKIVEDNIIEKPPINENAKKEIAFAKAKNSLSADFAFEGNFMGARAIEALKYQYNRNEVKNQSRFADRVKLLKHSYEYYDEILTSEKSSEISVSPGDSVEVFPNFTLDDFRKLKGYFEEKLKENVNENDVFLLPDFRFKIAMNVFAKFAKEIGINRNLQEVMSMPLGVNEATLAEITTAYQTILSGNIYKCRDTEWGDPCIIKELRLGGNVIFRNAVDSFEVLPQEVVLQMRAMLRAVFKYGTAISANSKIAIKYNGVNYPFPAMGKTGTTNENRTAAFIGMLPLDTALAIGSYVGFDGNEKLKGNRRSLAGASGALPQWTEFAASALGRKTVGGAAGSVGNMRIFGETVDYINMIASGEVPLPNMPQYIEVDRAGGLPLKADSFDADSSTAGVSGTAGAVKTALFPSF